MGAGNLISKTEIPAFIPRQDMMDQLLRWASNEATDPDMIGKYGLPIKVEPYNNKDGMLWGVTISILRDGALATEVGIRYDEEEVLKHAWVGRGADGFPTLEGESTSIVGKHMEIRCALLELPWPHRESLMLTPAVVSIIGHCYTCDCHHSEACTTLTGKAEALQSGCPECWQAHLQEAGQQPCGRDRAHGNQRHMPGAGRSYQQVLRLWFSLC